MLTSSKRGAGCDQEKALEAIYKPATSATKYVTSGQLQGNLQLVASAGKHVTTGNLRLFQACHWLHVLTFGQNSL